MQIGRTSCSSANSNSFELLVVELATACIYQGYKQNLIVSKCLRTVSRRKTDSSIRALFQI